jgi:uncharacterized protein
MKGYKEPLFTPVEVTKRIVSIDILRGIAVFGILLMNIAGMGLPAPGYGDPTIAGGSEGWNLNVWIMNNLFFEGTMRAIFSMLFGAGFILLTTRIEAKGGGAVTADVYYRRTIWLLIFGLVHGYLMGMFLYPFRNVTPYKLFFAGLVLLIIGSALDIKDYITNKETHEKAKIARSTLDMGGEPDKEYKEALEAWEAIEKDRKPSEEEIQERIDSRHKGYFSVVKSLAPINAKFQSEFAYRYDVWDILSMMLIGIALFRYSVFKAEKSFRFYWVMVLVGYPIGIGINLYETNHIISNNFEILAFEKAGMTYNIGRFFTAMGHIGLVMIFCKANLLKGLARRLAAVGKMALTNYIMHTVITGIIFLGFGFSMFGKLERHQLYFVVIGIWILQLILSPLWLKFFKMGPLEWFWRWLIYKQQPELAKHSPMTQDTSETR